MIKAINNYSSPAYIPDEASPNYVFPDNPLNEVQFTQVAPYKMTAKIALNSVSNCTGAFIGPKIMLTAAHCVSEVHTDSNDKVTRRTSPVDRIIPAQQCSSYTNDETESKKCAPYGFSELYDYTYTSYVNQDYWNAGLETNSSADWAVIVFSDTRYTEKTGYFGFKAVDNKAESNAIKNDDRVRITGYPVFSQNKNGDKMYTSNGKITGIYNEYSSFTYDAGMRGGDSGAGIEDINDKINFQLIGVNSKELCTNVNYEVENCPSEDRFNVGFMINHEVYSLLNSLRNDSYEVMS